jgi:aerobic carbon-monoxide dehydrogenase medium subunit
VVAAAFEYVAAGSYAEAVRLLSDRREEAKVLAGGQSLMPMLNLRLARPGLLIDINAADSRPPSVTGGTLALPALTRHRVLLEDELVREHCPLLAEAVRHVGNVRVRNRGTIAGSLAHADPTSEIGCCALATDAQVVVRGPDGERIVPAAGLFAGYWSTVLEESEVITDVLIPVRRARQGWSFHEMVRRTSDFAIVAVAAQVELDKKADVITGARVALAGVADRVVLADAELVAGLAGGTAEEADSVAVAIANSVRPSSDVHASGSYRQRLTRVLTARALRQAYTRATGPPARTATA